MVFLAVVEGTMVFVQICGSDVGIANHSIRTVHLAENLTLVITLHK